MREAAGALRRQRRGGGGARGGGADGVVERAADADERVPGAEGVQDDPHVHLRVRLLPPGRQPVRHIRGLLITCRLYVLSSLVFVLWSSLSSFF